MLMIDQATYDSYNLLFPKVGAFLAGAPLVETNFHTQIEADIRPFGGLLLGLFFVTTGTSIDIQKNAAVDFQILAKKSEMDRIEAEYKIAAREYRHCLILLALASYPCFLFLFDIEGYD